MKKIHFILILLYLVINIRCFDFNFENLKNLGLDKLKNISKNINFDKLKNLTNSINMTKFKEFGNYLSNKTQNLNVIKDYFSKNNTETNTINNLLNNIIKSTSENKISNIYQLFKYVNYFYPILKGNIYQLLKLIPHFNEFVDEYEYYGLSKEKKQKIIDIYKNNGKNDAKKMCIKNYIEIEILKDFSELICEIFVSHTIEKNNNLESDL